jgi:hypothetical protein
MTKIADLLARDFSWPGGEIDHVANDGSHPAPSEPDEYVATDRIKQEYDRLFSVMTAALKSPDEATGIWVSGPPGSGKSSFVRNLGYVLSDREVDGTPATALFLSKLQFSRITERAEFPNRSIPYEIFLVNLRTELARETSAQHIVEAMYRALLRELDYAEDYDISELEIELEKDGQLAPFQDLCRAQYNQEWREIRKTGSRLACASSLLHRLAPQTYDSADAWLKAIRARPSRRPSAKDLVEKTLDLCEFRRPGKAFAFIVDELGPYAKLGAERIENLRAVVERFGREGLQRLKRGKIPGPIWTVVTSRETMQEVSDHLAASRVSGHRLQDHFKHQVKLSLHDIREIVAHRVLRKKENQEPVLRTLFHDSGSSLIHNVKLEHCSRRSELEEDQFVRFYPYLPHMIDLSMEILAGIRQNPASPRSLVGSHPTIIQLCSDMLWSGRTRLSAQPVGALVSIDKIYELVAANIPPEKCEQIRRIHQRFDRDYDDSGLAGRVAKAICLMQFVQTDLPRTTKNIAALLIQNVSEDAPAPPVAKMLYALEEAQFVRESEDGWTLYDFDELRRRAAELKNLRNAVGAINPRPPGWRNDLIQTLKRLLARLLGWYTGPLYEFNASVSRTLEDVVQAVDQLTSSLIALDRPSVKAAFDYLPVNLAALEGELARLDNPGVPVAEPMRARIALLRQQVNVLADMQKTINVDATASSVKIQQRFEKRNDSLSSPAELQDQERRDMQWGRAESKDRTTYVIGLFGTGRRYINELLIENIGERTKYFRDGIRLHPGPTPMIYSGHITTKYPSRAQEAPVVMKYILESVKSAFADLIFVYRHPLDSLLTNWVWWRTYIRDNRAISGISEMYQNTDDLCAVLERNFADFKAFAEGDPGFFEALPGPRFLSFSEFVEETELHLQSNPLALRLEDFMIDPRKEFSKILEVMSVDVDLEHLSLAPPRTKPLGYLAVRERVPQFRNFIDGLDAVTTKRMEDIGYGLST